MVSKQNNSGFSMSLPYVLWYSLPAIISDASKIMNYV